MQCYNLSAPTMRETDLQKILLKGQLLLVRIKSLSILNLGLDLLDEHLLFLLRKLLLFLLDFDLVSGSIRHFCQLLLILNLSVLLQHPVSISLSLKVTGVHDPCFRTKLGNEFVVVRNDDNSSLEILNCSSKSSQTLTVKVVGRFVQNDNVRLHPHGSGQNNLDFLSSRKSRHTVVRSEFTVKTASFQVLFDVLGRKRLDEHTSKLGKLEIYCLHGLLPSHLLQSFGRQVFTRVHGRSSVLDFIFVFLALVHLTSSNKLRNNLLDLLDLSRSFINDLKLERFLLKSQLFIGELHRNLDQTFLILASVGKSPSDVLIRCLVQVSFDVVECVLGDVGNTGVGVLPDISLLRRNFSDKKLNHGRLSSTVFSDTGNTGTERNLDSNIVQSRLGVSGVGEGTVAHFHQGLTLGLNTLNGSRSRELELHLGGSQSEVSAGGRIDLDILVKVTLVSSELQVVESKNVGTAVIQQTRVVTDNDRSDILQGVEVSLNPGDVDNVKVVCGFIQQKNISLLKHSTGQSELHTPSSAQSGHSVVRLCLSVFSESDSSKNLTDLLLSNTHSSQAFIGGNIVDARKMGLFSLNICLDEDSSDLGNVGESFDLVVGNRSHESGLSTVIGSEKTVTVTSKKLHLSVVQKNLGTIGKSELTVAKFFGIIVVVVIIGDLQHFLGLLTNSFNVLFGFFFGVVGFHEWSNILGPLQVLHVVQVHHGCGDSTGMLDDGKLSSFGLVGLERLLEFALQL
mmetsp:Transcript_92680/g.267637  ORF Transcript_92680/g.267637 Transcript_92680/m.267637 type:complete len:737 (+) Transcript_92680:19-2229(+)